MRGTNEATGPGLAVARLMARQLLEAVANGNVSTAVIPAYCGDRWIDKNCWARNLSRRRVELASGPIYNIRRMADKEQ